MIKIIYYGLNIFMYLLEQKGKLDIFLMDCQMLRIPSILIGLKMPIVLLSTFSTTRKRVNSREMFLKTTKEIWNTFKKIYDNEKNIFRVFELFELLFTLQQGEISTPTYYSTLYDI